MSNNPLKIRQVHHIEFYVGNAKQADYFYRNAFGFDRIAYTGLETGNREQCSYALQQGTFKLLLTTPYTPRDPSGVHILKHGDGVRDMGQPFTGRVYYVRMDEKTIYVLQFTGRRNILGTLRSHTDQIARSFKLK